MICIIRERETRVFIPPTIAHGYEIEDEEDE